MSTTIGSVHRKLCPVIEKRSYSAYLIIELSAIVL